MSEQQTSSSASYNDSATAFAERVSKVRTTHRQRALTRTREELFPAFDPTGLGVTLAYEAMGNQPVTDQLSDQANALGLTFEHLGQTLGTVIHGANLKQTLPANLVDCLRATLLERKVIFFRDQNLNEREQVAFSRNFGQLDAFPFGKSGEDPYILEIRHDAQSPGTENGWHTDVTWMQEPSLGSVAQCVQVPPYGGDTLFSDSYAAYLGLPGMLREQLQHLAGIHDYRLFLGAGSRRLPDDLIADLKATIPFGVSHPLLRTHPETGKTALYIHGGFLRHDSLYDIRSGEGIGAEESTAIVAALLKAHGRPEYVCRFAWQAGSIAFWDNRSAQHYAVSDYYPHERLLRRVTVSGDKPYYAPQQAN